MSVANYDELAAHHGHDIVVVIYGGDQNAAVECETCCEVLLDFDRLGDGDNPAQRAALVAVAERHRLCPEDLAERVRAAARDVAAAVNSQGLSSQLAYLMAERGAEDARQLIDELAQSRRRR
jgi:hypothetical protein